MLIPASWVISITSRETHRRVHSMCTKISQLSVLDNSEHKQLLHCFARDAWAKSLILVALCRTKSQSGPCDTFVLDFTIDHAILPRSVQTTIYTPTRPAATSHPLQHQFPKLDSATHLVRIVDNYLYLDAHVLPPGRGQTSTLPCDTSTTPVHHQYYHDRIIPHEKPHNVELQQPQLLPHSRSGLGRPASLDHRPQHPRQQQRYC